MTNETETKSVWKDIGDSMAWGAVKTLVPLVRGNLTPYLVSSRIRMEREKYDGYLKLYRMAHGIDPKPNLIAKAKDLETRFDDSGYTWMGFGAGLATGAVGLAANLAVPLAQICFFANHPKYLLALPVANLASWAYEKAREKIYERKIAKSIEEDPENNKDVLNCIDHLASRGI